VARQIRVIMDYYKLEKASDIQIQHLIGKIIKVYWSQLLSWEIGCIAVQEANGRFWVKYQELKDENDEHFFLESLLTGRPPKWEFFDFLTPGDNSKVHVPDFLTPGENSEEDLGVSQCFVNDLSECPKKIDMKRLPLSKSQVTLRNANGDIKLTAPYTNAKGHQIVPTNILYGVIAADDENTLALKSEVEDFNTPELMIEYDAVGAEDVIRQKNGGWLPQWIKIEKDRNGICTVYCCRFCGVWKHECNYSHTQLRSFKEMQKKNGPLCSDPNCKNMARRMHLAENRLKRTLTNPEIRDPFRTKRKKI